MPGYLVHFSRQSDKDYTQTEQYLRSFDSFCRLSTNADTWIVGTDIGQALTIRDQMLKLSPPNTQIFVLSLTSTKRLGAHKKKSATGSKPYTNQHPNN